MCRCLGNIIIINLFQTSTLRGCQIIYKIYVVAGSDVSKYGELIL